MDQFSDNLLQRDRAPVRVPLWILTLLVLSGTLAMHIFVPALPSAAADLGASRATIQQTVTFYIAGLAIAQLVYGPISDRFGRRRTLMAGLALYTLAGLAAAIAAEVQTLIVARLFQALGGGAGLVIGRAIVRDTSSPGDTTRRLAMMNLATTLGPTLAPIMGSVIAAGFGWRPIFWLLCVLGLTNLVIAWRLLPETNASAGSENASTLAKNYWGLLHSPRFLGYCLGGSCATTSMYAFLAAAPFVFMQQMNRTEFEVGIYLAILIISIALASVLATRLSRFVANEHILVGASLLSTIAAVIYLGVVLADRMDAYLVVFLMSVNTFGVGLAAPSGLTQIMSINPRVIGSSAGLFGFVQMAVGAICTSLVGIGDNPALAVAIVLVTACLIAQISFWLLLMTAGSDRV